MSIPENIVPGSFVVLREGGVFAPAGIIEELVLGREFMGIVVARGRFLFHWNPTHVKLATCIIVAGTKSRTSRLVEQTSPIFRIAYDPEACYYNAKIEFIR